MPICLAGNRWIEMYWFHLGVQWCLDNCVCIQPAECSGGRCWSVITIMTEWSHSTKPHSCWWVYRNAANRLRNAFSSSKPVRFSFVLSCFFDLLEGKKKEHLWHWTHCSHCSRPTIRTLGAFVPRGPVFVCVCSGWLFRVCVQFSRNYLYILVMKMMMGNIPVQQKTPSLAGFAFLRQFTMRRQSRCAQRASAFWGSVNWTCVIVVMNPPDCLCSRYCSKTQK